MSDETPDDVIAQEDTASPSDAGDAASPSDAGDAASHIEAERAGEHAEAAEQEGQDHDGHDHEGHDHGHDDHAAHEDDDHGSHGHGAPDPNEGVLVGEPPTPAWVMAAAVIGLVTLIAVVILGIALQDQVPDRLEPGEGGVPVTSEG